MTIALKADASGTFGSVLVGDNDAMRFGSDTSGQPFSFRNKLINGNFELWQRGASIVNPNVVYTADRWHSFGNNTTFAAVAGFNGVSNFVLSLAATNAVNNAIAAQPLESLAAYPISGRTLTFSFYYAASANQPAGVLAAAVQKNATANTASGGAWSTIVGTVQSLTPTTTAQRAVITFVMPNDGSAAGLRPHLSTANLTNGTSVYIWGAQLEEGSIATKFEMRPYTIEQQLCQRYYEAGVEPMFFMATGASAIAAAYGELYFKVQKRANPTVTATGWQYYNVGAGAAFTPAIGASQDKFTFQGTGLTNWNGWAGSGTWAANAELT